MVNCWLKRGVVLHNALHGFRGGQESGTYTLEAKLAQHLAGLAHDTPFQVFLDIRNAYDSLDKEKFLEVLSGYGVGKNLIPLLKSYWERHRIAPNTGKFLRNEFRTGRGLTQGYPTSPMTFNIVVSAVVHKVLYVVCGPQEAKHGLGWAAGERNVIFYSGDGMIVGQDH